MEIADKFSGDTVVVSTRVFRVRIARSRFLSTKSNIIFIGAVITVVVTVANLPRENAASIVTLETITTDAFIAAVTLLKRKVIELVNTSFLNLLLELELICFQKPTSSSELSPQSSTPLHRSSS